MDNNERYKKRSRRFFLLSKKQWIGIAVLAAVVLGYVAMFTIVPHRTDAEPIELYFADRMTEAHRILIDRFNELNNGKIKVIPIHFPNAEFSTDTRKEVLARSLRGEDDAIDIFAVDIIGVHRFAKWSEPLEQYFSDEELRGILPVAMKTCYYNGNLMAMPFVLVQGVMYYREDLLSNSKEGRELLKKVQNGITWEEFVTARHTMEMKNPFYIFQASDYEGFICSYIENLLSLNPNYFETKGFNFTTRESRQALQYLVDLVQTEKLSPPIVTSFTEFNSFQYFIQNDGLFVRGWTTYDKDFESEPVDLKKQQCLRKALTPHPAQGRPATVLGGWNLMISKSSKKKDAAVAFMKFLLQNESQEILYKYAGYHPIVQEFYANPMYEQRYPEIKEMRTFMRYGVLRPVQENYTRYSKIMARYFSLAVAGKMSVDDALREAQHAIDLEERQKNGKGMAK